MPPPFVRHPAFFAGFFKIPSLWGVKKTAPYFHDNSAKTLGEVAAFYTKSSLWRGVREKRFKDTCSSPTSFDEQFRVPELRQPPRFVAAPLAASAVGPKTCEQGGERRLVFAVIGCYDRPSTPSCPPYLQSPWIVIVEPDADATRLVVVTVYGVSE